MPDTLSETFIIPHAQATFTVHGDPDGGLHEGVKVYLFTSAGYYVGQYRITDENGQATFDLPERNYKVRLSYLGYQYWLEDILVSGDTAIDMPIDQKAVTITVNGIYQGREPVEDARVHLYTEKEKYAGLYDYSDAVGQVVFDLPDRDYKAQVDYLGYQFWSDTIRFEDAVVEIDMGLVRLHVTRDGQGVADARIKLFTADGAYLARNGYTDDEGVAEFLLPDRAYKFLVYHDNQQHWTPEITVVAGKTAAVEAAFGTETAAIFSITPEIVVMGQTAVLAWQTDNVDACTLIPGVGGVDAEGRLDVSPDQTTTYTLTAEGPADTATLSVTLEVIQEDAPKSVEFPDAEWVGGDSYRLYVDNITPYTVSGVYHNIPGAVTVTAVLGDTTRTGSGGGGHFSLELPSVGAWRIAVAANDGSADATAMLEVIADDAGPEITLDGPDQITTTDDFIAISSTITDAVSGLDTVSITTDCYPGQEFGAIVTPLGAVTSEVPLCVGDNYITITARDENGQESQVTLTVTVVATAFPSVAITAPENGSVVLTDRVDVTGTVRSSLPPEQIRLSLEDQVIFPTGQDSEYSFTFENVHLLPGINNLIVQAETVYGDVADQVLVNYTTKTDTEETSVPTIEVFSPLAGAFLEEDPVVKGLARSDLGIVSVLVNGEPATLTGAGTTEASFTKALSFPQTGEDELEITVVATDGAGESRTLTYTVSFDNTPPVILLSSADPAQPPAVNVVVDSSYNISGQVVERNLVGLTLNDQNIDVLPGVDPDTWTFSTTVALTNNVEQLLTLTAWDFAGQQTGTEWIVRREGGVDIELIHPRNNAELESDQDVLPVAVTVRLAGAVDTDMVTVQIDDDDPVVLARSGTTATGEVSVDATREFHTLLITVENASGEITGHLESQFTTLNAASIPLSVQRQEPANGDTGVEPNDFIAFYFSKALDMERLEVQVKETAHGLVYAGQEKGADLTQFNQIELVEVHRDQETVPGSIADFPGDAMAAFYAERDYAYGATIYVTVLYDGEEISRSNFTIRPLPTFIQGIVMDQFQEPVAGIKVSIPELGRTAVTDSNGNYGFGFEDTADNAIPGGRYLALINPNLDNRTFGSHELWASVEAERLNEMGVSVISVLNTQTPFYRITSNTADQILAKGDLVLDTGAAELFFPDGRNQGDIHVQFLSLNELAYPTRPSAIPHWAYSIQPMGIEVTGQVDLTFDMPALYGSHDYVDSIGSLVILVGLDPDALQLVPVGAGMVDADARQVISVGTVALERLDYLGYAFVPEEQQEIVERYVNGEIGLREMIGALEK